jgi:Fe-S-cluster containining protein
LGQTQGRKEGILFRDSFLRFGCHPGVPCFTKCCRDVNIFLGPYDIVRLRKSLGISSGEFLARYTLSLVPDSTGFPLVLLKMGEDRERACPLLGPGGCSVYHDRPWSCRMFPLDRAEADGCYRLVAPRELCLGLQEGSGSTVGEYLESQEVAAYEEVEARLARSGPDPSLLRGSIRNPRIQEMCRMAMYDPDKFRRFVLESRFLQVFHVERELVEVLPTDDVALLELGQRWLRFGLVAGESMKIREELVNPKARQGAAPEGGNGRGI